MLETFRQNSDTLNITKIITGSVVLGDIANWSGSILVHLGVTSEKWPDLNINWLGSLIAAIIFAAVVGVLTLCRRLIAPVPDIGGRWYFRLETIETEYNPYRNMLLFYEVTLHQEDATIEGAGEKYYEKSVNGNIPYTGIHRSIINLRGTLKPGFTSYKLNVQYTERNEVRVSSSTHKLKARRKWLRGHGPAGTFTSTIAGQSGKVTWSRKRLAP